MSYQNDTGYNPYGENGENGDTCCTDPLRCYSKNVLYVDDGCAGFTTTCVAWHGCPAALAALLQSCLLPTAPVLYYVAASCAPLTIALSGKATQVCASKFVAACREDGNNTLFRSMMRAGHLTSSAAVTPVTMEMGRV